jgi:hypothetical protein
MVVLPFLTHVCLSEDQFYVRCLCGSVLHLLVLKEGWKRLPGCMLHGHRPSASIHASLYCDVFGLKRLCTRQGEDP